MIKMNYKYYIFFILGSTIKYLKTNNKLYATKSNVTKNIVFIDGVRTPFLHSGTSYKNLMAYDLARHSLV